MKKALKTQLFAAIAMMVVAAIALTSVGYAWFTSVANPVVRDLDLYVKAADSMYLSAKTAPVLHQTSDWKVTVTKGDITTEQGLPVFPAELTNVSSTLTAASHDFYFAEHNSSGVLTGFAKEGETGYQGAFVRFNLWVKSTNNGYVYINKDSTMTALTNSLANSGVPLLTAPGKHIQDTIRVGFVPLNYDADGAGTGTASAGADWTHSVIWEPNSAEHLDTMYGGPGGNAKIAMQAVIGNTTTDLANQTTFDFGVGTTNATEGQALADKIFLFNLRKDTMQQFSVYIWVEGQDLDTVNTVAKNFFLTFLKFGQEKDVPQGTYTF